jgi:hypothetical protein
MIATEDRVTIPADAGRKDLELGPACQSGAHRSAAATNLGLRLVVEMATFASLGYWGASVNGSAALRASLALIAPLVAMATWSRLLAPRAPRRLAGIQALMVELSIFACATWALFLSGMGLAGVIYGSLAVANALLTRALGQYAPGGRLPGGNDR